MCPPNAFRAPRIGTEAVLLIPDDDDDEGTAENREAGLLHVNDNSEKENDMPDNDTDEEEDDDGDEPENGGRFSTRCGKMFHCSHAFALRKSKSLS